MRTWCCEVSKVKLKIEYPLYRLNVEKTNIASVQTEFRSSPIFKKSGIQMGSKKLPGNSRGILILLHIMIIINDRIIYFSIMRDKVYKCVVYI